MKTNIRERLEKYTYVSCSSTKNDYLDSGLKLYITSGIDPGGFLSCVISNDLRGATIRADAFNAPILDQIFRDIKKILPKEAYGSYDKMDAWMNDRNGIRSAYVHQKEKEYTLKALQQKGYEYD